MQVVNMSAYIQSQISTVSAQSGFYEGHMVSISLGSIRCLCWDQTNKLLAKSYDSEKHAESVI